MNHNYISEISRILGVSEDSIKAMPDDIQNSMQAVFDTFEVKTDDDRKQVYDALDTLWTKGSIYIELSEIAGVTGISYTTFRNLDFDTQQEIVYEYMANTAEIGHIYELVNKALAVSDLDKVAKLLEIPVRELHKLPLNVREQMCGHYAMEYEENSSNAELIRTLKGLMFP